MSNHDNRSPTPEDKKLGELIRSRRLLADMSQEELGKKLGVSFQQVQKYEKGTNRITFLRLKAIAHALGEGMGYFDAEMKPASKRAGEVKAQLADPHVIRLLEAFKAIPDGKRMSLIHVAEALMEDA